MPNWNRIIVGDAFKLPSRNPRFYLDTILWFPTFMAGCWFLSCFHGLRIVQWDLREAGLSFGAICIFLLLIKERTVLIASMFAFAAYSAGLHFAIRGDTKAFVISSASYICAAAVLVGGTVIRIHALKKPDFDPTYRQPDRENSWLGAVLVLGILFGIGAVGIYLSWRDFAGFAR